MVEHRALLDACYRQVFFADGETAPIKTFDDCLTDFYLYLLEAKPKRVDDDVEGYYLQQVKDEQALPEWLRQTFRRFLLQEHKILVELQDALAEYRQQLALQRPGDSIDLTLMHVAFALAWFNQHESELDRYLFFRSAYKHFSGFYEWPDEELNDTEIGLILKLTPGNIRTRTSRLTAKVRRLVHELNDAAIAGLNRTSLDIAHSIYRDPDPDIEAILRDLLDKAERQLPQYAEIIAMRQAKRESMIPLEPCCSYEMDMDEFASSLPSMAPSMAPGFAKDAFGVCCENASICKPIRTENRIVRLFKQFIGI